MLGNVNITPAEHFKKQQKKNSNVGLSASCSSEEGNLYYLC